jgi:Spy/CpxP family protein refolding chaperone
MFLTARGIGIVASALLAGGAVAGCGTRSATASPPATAASATDDDNATAGLTEHHRYHHHGGVTLFVAMSLDTLGISPEQRADIDKIRADLHARMEPARTAEQTLVATLADGLAAGNVDAAKVDASVAQVTSAAAAVHDACADALNDLHGVLRPEQRAALVDKVESHWAVWQNANAEEPGPANAKSGRLATLATELDLTPDQVDKIQAGLNGRMNTALRLDSGKVATHLRAFGDAFRSEKFDARGLAATANDANAQVIGWGAAHLAIFVETLAPVLTEDQRAKLAERLREHATHNPSAQGNP